jgi:hypothetical protein
MTMDGDPMRRATLISGTTNPTGLSLLRQLAVGGVATIAGVFVEDRSLLRAAALPSTREVGRVSGMLHSLDLADVETALRREAAHLRAALAALAGELQRAWSFDVARGDIVAEALGLAAHARVAVLQARPQRRPSAADIRDTERGAIAVLHEPGGSDQWLEVAIALSNAGGRRLNVYLPPSSMPAPAALRERLTGAVTSPVSISTYAGTAPAMARAWLREPSRVLVLPTAMMTATTDGFAMLLRQLSLSVLLLD